jgi:hypothetical protein
VLLIFHHPRRFFLFFRALDSLELAGHTKKGVIESIARRRKTKKKDSKRTRSEYLKQDLSKDPV